MTLLDKVISYVSPDTAFRRECARKRLEILDSGYSRHGASRHKKSLIGWLSAGGSPDDDIVDNLDIMRDRSRDLYMGTPMATGAIKTTKTNVVGAGLVLKPQLDADFLNMSEDEADEWEKQVGREFSYWSEKECDASGMQSFGQLQSLAFLSVLMSGDVFALLPVISNDKSVYSLRVRLIEADQVCDPPFPKAGRDILGGVEIDRYGGPVAYWVAKKHPKASRSLRNEWTRVPIFGERTGRRNIVHLAELERPGQRRGVPLLAPVIEALKQLGRYTEAELMAAVVSGLFTVFIKSDSPDNGLGRGVPVDEQISQDDDSYELGNGAIVSLGDNESIQEANPARPNTSFDGFVTSISRQIGAALELPYELLVKNFTASYSASRGSLLEAWKMFRTKRTWLGSRFCQPIYDEWLAEAVARGRIKAPGFFDDPLIRHAYAGAEWHGPSQGQIDPLKEVKAAKIRVMEGFSTRSREASELTGSDWEKNHRQRMKEEKMRLEIPGGSENEEVLED